MLCLVLSQGRVCLGYTWKRKYFLGGIHIQITFIEIGFCTHINILLLLVDFQGDYKVLLLFPLKNKHLLFCLVLYIQSPNLNIVNTSKLLESFKICLFLNVISSCITNHNYQSLNLQCRHSNREHYSFIFTFFITSQLQPWLMQWP